jgi:ubiquitin carboxyl-terminal hydrolase 4/11/15
VKFDPYCSIKVSLVTALEDRSQKFDVSVMLLTSPKVPIEKYTVSVLKRGNAGDLIEATAKQANLDPECCFLGEIYTKKFYKIFEKYDAVDQIGANDTLVLYELPKMTGSDKCELVIHARQELKSTYSYNRHELVGIPMVSSVNRMTTGRDLIETVRAEFAKRLGFDSGFDDKWRLVRTSDKSSVGMGREENLIVVTPDSESIDLGSRHYVIATFNEDFTVPEILTNMFEERAYGYRSSGRSSVPATDLFRCFEMMKEEEKLSPDDMWYCSRCKEHREAFKKLEIWSLPPVLVLQLKRFTYNSYSRDRLDTPVNFPLEGLDLSFAVLGPEKSNSIYDLISISKHMGGLGGGHYVAYGRSSENGKWYYFNDSMVTESSAEEVANDQVGAYVLFYIRRDRRPPSWR